MSKGFLLPVIVVLLGAVIFWGYCLWSEREKDE